jgi:hypothetical protein
MSERRTIFMQRRRTSPSASRWRFHGWGLICLELRSTHAAATARFVVARRPLGLDVRLTDLYPEMYLAADGYLPAQALDASDVERLRYAFELAGADCTAIVTNTPHKRN